MSTIDIKNRWLGKAENDFKAGVLKGLPVIIGYLPIAISFGIIAMQTIYIYFKLY